MEKNWKRRRKGKFVFIGLAMIVGALLLVALVQFLWNQLMTDIFNLKAISYWQALGLLVLSKILIGGGGFKSKGRCGGRFRRGNEGCPTLDEEDKSRFREEWRRRFADRCKPREEEGK